MLCALRAQCLVTSTPLEKSPRCLNAKCCIHEQSAAALAHDTSTSLDSDLQGQHTAKPVVKMLTEGAVPLGLLPCRPLAGHQQLAPSCLPPKVVCCHIQAGIYRVYMAGAPRDCGIRGC